MKARYPVRYPVGFHGRGKCVYALENVDTDAPVPLDYVQSRKAIYEPLYARLARKCPKYQVLLSKLKKGENLLIIEVDGPHQESMPYYKQKYGVADDFITDHTMLVTPENIDIVLNDTKHPYGHGYCLSHALYQNI